MGPLRRDRCVSWIAGIRFYGEASKGVVATPRIGGDKMGTLGHDASNLSFLI